MFTTPSSCKSRLNDTIVWRKNQIGRFPKGVERCKRIVLYPFYNACALSGSYGAKFAEFVKEDKGFEQYAERYEEVSDELSDDMAVRAQLAA